MRSALLSLVNRHFNGHGLQLHRLPIPLVLSLSSSKSFCRIPFRLVSSSCSWWALMHSDFSTSETLAAR